MGQRISRSLNSGKKSQNVWHFKLNTQPKQPKTPENEVVEIDSPTTVTTRPESKDQKSSHDVKTEVESATEPEEPMYFRCGYNHETTGIYAFKKGKMLGSGRYAKVFEAEGVVDGHPVALKFIPRDKITVGCYSDGRLMPVEIMCMLNLQQGFTHPSVIRLYNWYALKTECIYVLELPPDSEDLSKYIKRHGGCLDENTAHIIMRQVVEAVQYCYSKGVAHCNIHPCNLLINRKTLKVKLIDFGSAEIKGRHYKMIARPGPYNPPEALIEKQYNKKSVAVWSLGILLFQMVCGHFPSTDDLYEFYAKTWKHESLSEDLSNLISSCLQYKPKKRINMKKMHHHPWFQVLTKCAENTQPRTPANEIDKPTTVTMGQRSSHNQKAEQQEPEAGCSYIPYTQPRTPANEVVEIHRTTNNEEKMDSTMTSKNFPKDLFRLKPGTSKSSKKVKHEENQQAREEMDPRQENNKNEDSVSAARSQQNLKIHSLENEDTEKEPIKTHNKNPEQEESMCNSNKCTSSKLSSETERKNSKCVSTNVQDPPSKTKTDPFYLTHRYNPLGDPFTLYKRGKMLGSGTSGEVFEAERISDGCRVALKVIPRNKVITSYYCNYEYQIPVEVTCMLEMQKGPKHPSIIQLLEWYALKTHYVYVLELPPDSEDLSKYITRHGGCLDENTVHNIMHQVVKAVECCYNKGVAHRDIKPSNLLINRKTLNVKLIDFGSADIKERYYKKIEGTKAYYPSEAFIKKRYKGKSAAVWSLGLVLFQMVCGRFPSADELHRIYTKLWKHESMSRDLSHLICSCLQYKPQQRIGIKKIHRHPWFKVFMENQCRSIPNTQPRTPVNEVVELDRPSNREEKMDSTMKRPNINKSLKMSFETEREKSKCVSTCVQDTPSETDLFLTHRDNLFINPIELFKRGKMLGSGGSGKVFEAERVSDGRQVALKIIPRDKVKTRHHLNYEYPIPVEVSCMLQVQKSPTHPSIIRLLEWYALKTHYIYVLELLPDSEDLSKYITQHGGCLDENTAYIIMHQVVKAVECCYNKGVAHRDIKPSNLLINRKTLKVRLIDFGSADFTETFGKWYHGNSAAVWSLGILLFEMVCGHLPSAEELNRIYAKTWKHESMAGELSDLICSCLQNKPKERIDLKKMLFHPWFCPDGTV